MVMSQENDEWEAGCWRREREKEGRVEKEEEKEREDGVIFSLYRTYFSDQKESDTHIIFKIVTNIVESHLGGGGYSRLASSLVMLSSGFCGSKSWMKWAKLASPR